MQSYIEIDVHSHVGAGRVDKELLHSLHRQIIPRLAAEQSHNHGEADQCY